MPMVGLGMLCRKSGWRILFTSIVQIVFRLEMMLVTMLFAFAVQRVVKSQREIWKIGLKVLTIRGGG